MTTNYVLQKPACISHCKLLWQSNILCVNDPTAAPDGIPRRFSTKGTCRVPGVNQQRVPKLVGLQQQPDWCHDIFLQEDLQVVYVPIKTSVYGFDIQTGVRINDWEDIHKQSVTAVVHPPGSNHVITGSHDMTAKVSFTT